jgi:hypothetical protein
MMKNNRPPVLATRLLERLVSGPHGDALAGDLIEQYRQGRSGAWYWRQVLAAILAGVGKGVRDHKLQAAGAVAIGMAFYLLSSFPVNWLARWLANEGILRFFWSSIWLTYTACAASGWIVGRIPSVDKPADRLAMVCMCGASLLLFESVRVGVGFFIGRAIHPITPQLLAIFVLVLFIRPLLVLLGGLAGVLASGTTTSHRTHPSSAAD